MIIGMHVFGWQRAWVRCAVVILCAVGLRAPAQTVSRTQQVRAGTHALLATWNSETGLFRGTGWWNSANGITALENSSTAMSGDTVARHVAATFALAQKTSPGFLNEFYDDEGWWALAWLRAYQVQGDPRYLQMAASIFTDMRGGWSDTCGGGIWWKKNEHYKNAIANELFLSVATGLAQVSQGQERADYVAWAQREAKWFLASGMINSEGLVNDGLDAACHNNGRTTWSYNQGVLLTGLAQLAQLSGEPAPLAMANRIAHAAMTHLVDAGGVLHDTCEPDCGADGIQFKGIFVRNLHTLDQIAPAPEYRRFLDLQADSVWTRARTPSDHFSVNWAGPPADSGTGSLISALDALDAARR